jgi:hypothetical protein
MGYLFTCCSHLGPIWNTANIFCFYVFSMKLNAISIKLLRTKQAFNCWVRQSAGRRILSPV